MVFPKAILFDMDGTLTEPYLDYALIKRDLGIDPDHPILESLAKMTSSQRAEAEIILHRHENAAAEASSLNPGCEELLHWLKHQHVPTALVTRNTRKSVRTVFDLHGLHFEVCITREDGKFKPDPAPLLLACEKLGVAATDSWMVGDSIHDIDAAANAKIPSVWISHNLPRPFMTEPTITCPDLHQLTLLLKRCLNQG